MIKSDFYYLWNDWNAPIWSVLSTCIKMHLFPKSSTTLKPFTYFLIGKFNEKDNG